MNIEQQRALALAQARRRRAEAEGAAPAAPTQPEDVRGASGVPGGVAAAAPAPRPVGMGQYVGDTASIGLRGARRGAADLVGLPVDIVNLIMGAAGLPVSQTPFGGGASIDALSGAPETLAREVFDMPAPEPQDMTQRIVGRVGREVGATAVPVGAALATAARVGKEGARAMGPLGRMFVEPAAVAPASLVGRETAAAVAAGTGAGVANEMAGNEQVGDNFWSDFLGSLGGLATYGAGSAILGAGKNAAGAVLSRPNMMDDVARQEVADRIINNSSDMATQFAERGTGDTSGLVQKLRTPSAAEQAVPGYVANIGDRTGDPRMQALVYSQDAVTPGAAQMRRTANDTAVESAIQNAAPNGDPAQFRAGLEANRDSQIAEALDAEDIARLIFGDAEQNVQPTMRDATARGSSLRAGLDDAYTGARAKVDELYAPLNNSDVEVPVGPLRERFEQTQAGLPVNDRDRFLPSEASLPDRLAGDNPDAVVPLREVMSARSGLSDDIRTQRAGSQNQAARVTSKFRDQIDEFTDTALPPDVNELYDAARAARRDVGDRFERPGTGIAETLRPREGGGFALDDSAVASRFTPTDQGNLNDLGALLREAGGDPRVRTALADEVLSDVQTRGLLNKPEQLKKYLGERNTLLGNFPELRDKLTQASAAGEYRTGVEKASEATQKRLTTPGRSAQASYLKFGDEATVDAVRNLVAGPKPREAVKELLEAAGNTPAARQDAKAALWEVVKTKKFSAENSTGGDRWNARKLRDMFSDPKTSAVAEELWADAPEDLAKIEELFGALASAEGSTRARAPGTSGTAQALSGKFDPALSASSVASRLRNVSRGVVSPQITAVDLVSTWLRRRSAQVQSRAIDTMASAAFNNPGMAADILELMNPADYAAKRAMVTQKYGVRATQLLNLTDEIIGEDDVTGAAMADPGDDEDMIGAINGQ